MAEFPFQSSMKHISLKKQAESLDYRKFKKRLRTNDRFLRIRTGRHVAEFDKAFCAGAEPHDLMTQIDALMGGGQILKDGPASSLSRLTWNGKDVVVKRYNYRGFIHSLRHTLKRSRACRAWLHGHRLDMLGIATPRSLAYIEQHRGPLIWSSYLVTEYIEGQRLQDFLQDSCIAEEHRFKVLQEVIGLLEKLWTYRITHGDLKHTNILITKSGPVLTDLDGMMVHRWKLLYQNKQARDVERFLQGRDGSLIAHNYTQRLISEKSALSRRLADDFDNIRTGAWAIRVGRDFPKDSIRSLLSADDSHGDSQGGFSRVPSSDYTCVFKGHVSFNGMDLPVYLKQYLFHSWLDFAKHLPRASRARCAFEASLMLLENGFDAPAVLALFERRLGPFATDNMLATREVGNATPMPQLLREISQRSDTETLVNKRGLIRAFAETVGQMHARGIFHGDLRLGNILAVKEHENWRFYFIDNERTKKFRSLPTRLRLKNLVQINMFYQGISKTDRLRFLRSYLESNPRIADHYSAWIRRITAKTNRRLRRKHWPEE